jgi:hypothetical protein
LRDPAKELKEMHNSFSNGQFSIYILPVQRNLSFLEPNFNPVLLRTIRLCMRSPIRWIPGWLRGFLSQISFQFFVIVQVGGFTTSSKAGAKENSRWT